jgi:hypothetical protein
MGSSSNNRAQREAQAQEEARQRAIQAAQAQVGAIFDNPDRQGQADRLAADTVAFYTRDLDRQAADTDRNLRFALARSGQTGGSVAIDQNRRVGDDYLRGVLDVNRRGQEAAANLRQADEQARANLLAMAQGGLDATTASQQAAQSLRNNLLAGQAGATANQLGSMFGQFGDFFRNSRDNAQWRRGLNSATDDIYRPMFGPGGGFGG